MISTSVKNNQTTRWLFLALAVFILFLFWQMILPFALTIFTAGIFAVLFAGVDRWLSLRLHSPIISAGLITLGTVLIVFLPLTWLAIVVAQQASDVLLSSSVGQLSERLLHFANDLSMPPVITRTIASIDFPALGNSVFTWLRENIGILLAGGANVVVQFSIFFIFLFYFILRKEDIKREIFELSPFKDTTDKSIISRISRTIRSVIVSAIIISLFKAILTALGLWMFGVPKAILWGSLAIIAAQVPIIGVALIMLPAILFLAFKGSVAAAFGLTIWSVVVVGLTDNVLSPLLVGRRTQMPEVLVLVSILGGIQYFGPIGFIVGPVILAGVLVIRDLHRSGVLG